MKQYLFSLMAAMALNLSVQAMTYGQAQREALFLTDKMAYELGLSVEQFEAAYEINLDYLMLVNRDQDLYGMYWSRRNTDLRYVLNSFQYRKFVATNYFYRPLNWGRGGWTLAIYGRYADPHFFFFAYPRNWNTYRGGGSMDGRSRYATRNFYAPGANGRPATGHAPLPYKPGSHNGGHQPNPGNGVHGTMPPHQGGGYYNDGNRQPGQGNGNRQPGQGNGNRQFGQGVGNDNKQPGQGNGNGSRSQGPNMGNGNNGSQNPNPNRNGTSSPRRSFGK